MFPMRRAKHKVLWAVVLLVAVAMVDFLAFPERASDDRLDNHDVLANVTVVIGASVIWAQYQPIAILHNKRLAVEVRTATPRTKAWRSDSSSANDYPDSALSARPVSGSLFHGNSQTLAFVGAKVSTPVLQFTGWTIELYTASSARHVWDRRFGGLLGATRGECSECPRAGLLQRANRVIARLAAEDPFQLKTRRREVHFPPAGGAMTKHKPILLHFGGSWKA